MSDQDPQNSSWQRTRCMSIFSRNFENHAENSPFWFSSTKILKKNPQGWSGAFNLSSPSTNLTRELGALRLFKVPPCRNIISMNSPEFEPKSYGTAINFANHYIGLTPYSCMKAIREDLVVLKYDQIIRVTFEPAHPTTKTSISC
ncbi:hypothetical protein TNCV_3410911 [Trichonephila clavipes]|nr:hypothetical protein TNCV_3410911 [Trichonephila clavipes]